MDHELVGFRCRHDDDLEKVCSAVWAEDKPAVGIFSGVFDSECMVDGVEDVCVGHAMLAGRLMDLHTKNCNTKSGSRSGSCPGRCPELVNSELR